MQLEWTATRDGVALRGDIDEKCMLDPLADELQDGAVLDLSGVERVNSVGVRMWLAFIGRLQGRSLKLSACSVPIVHQLNMIARFGGDAEVTSIHAPFLCPECDASATTLVELAADVDAQLAAERLCPKCGAHMEFDDVPSSYLAFLRVRS